jgi:hypothetical protein
MQPAIWPQSPVQVAKQGNVVANPVKRCRAENAVKVVAKRKRHKIGNRKTNTIREIGP